HERGLSGTYTLSLHDALPIWGWLDKSRGPVRVEVELTGIPVDVEGKDIGLRVIALCGGHSMEERVHLTAPEGIVRQRRPVALVCLVHQYPGNDPACVQGPFHAHGRGILVHVYSVGTVGQ